MGTAGNQAMGSVTCQARRPVDLLAAAFAIRCKGAGRWLCPLAPQDDVQGDTIRANAGVAQLPAPVDILLQPEAVAGRLEAAQPGGRQDT